MAQENNDREQLGRRLGGALRAHGADCAPASLRAQIRAATAAKTRWPSWRWLAAAACAAVLVTVALWLPSPPPAPIAEGDEASSEERVRWLEHALLHPLLLLEAAAEWEGENEWIAAELYREACATAVHPVVAWLAAYEASRFDENEL